MESLSRKTPDMQGGKTYIVEHLDDELGPWSELEYITIARESHQFGSKFCLSSVPSSLDLPEALLAVPGFTAAGESVETLYAEDKSRVCLLDPSATKELSPEDDEKFDVFLFGGILGTLSCSKSHLILTYVAGDDPPRGKNNYPTLQPVSCL
jgi:ribosome biogenesis SPOUT family RNA methylase Rps3